MEKSFIDLIKDAGIIGAGGAGFPTHVKLNAKVKTVIVNGAECEPLLKVDQQLMDKKADEILYALNKVVDETESEVGIIALKGKYKSAINTLNSKIKDYPKLQLFMLENFYPAGDEQILVYEVTNKIVPEGGIPLNVEVIVINVETLLNVYNAINGIPVTEKYLTITGEVKNPITVKVPIGISIEEAIEIAGGSSISDFCVIDGGPMMGKIVEDIQSPIKKNTKGLIVLKKEHKIVQSKIKSIQATIRDARIACCQCSLCTEVCPRHLLGHKIEPSKIMRIASYGKTCSTEISPTNTFLCSECAICEQVCIMGLQPWKLNRFFKGELSKNGIRNPHNRIPEKADEFRRYRKFPVERLKQRLDINKYNSDSLLEEKEYDFQKVTILRSQHIGAKAEPIVKIGDKVQKGDLIGEISDGKLGAKIHASIDGIIKEITDESIVIVK
ncbi:4Fe-4S dicluster domain-containing protein [Clostridium beijerinckii]|jgi:Predicted NADH:ubiquinone oxidoreductase, subunit RnfC|uniref:SLBB domain-containing protein n=2 Tax=Clostridium beijerinckii TaxID=1520 RepID=A0AAE2V0S3_CLOBE|nr:4Fe-4S dicluster domain-containing protein [Clostridium beijerinckii]ABR36154.1 Respiratory-chain NADH dehydrogenase domain, 51 kDa subunit [Clostridium beijerinckii NCIMB 8052]AIU03687.1 respiratory-chain NADH dehydrogenase domain-containing protein [Clostridium beijerinckii ATCC 35702]MBF7809198.1 SLBB domain-containing protein [Clostridium beijerinckii]NRT22788.1 Na+-translocating ferredoxin:NAD+ oxidoreductase RnfC subunit [Clostridium beijerinckii]NRT64694.1 Na+-translocating ferredoxi